MKIHIHNLLNYGGDFEFELVPGINLVTGMNGAGKTNLSRIIGALVSHQPNPHGLSVAAAKSYLHDGKTEGFAVRFDDKGQQVRWVPPDRFVVPEGVNKLARPHTVNLMDFVAIASITDRKKRSEAYEALFLPNNPESLLRPAWEARNLPEGQLKTVLKLINDPAQGWGGAQKIYADHARQAKANWNDITGKRWGKQAAPKWKPENWVSELEGLSEDDVLTDLTNAQEALRAIGVKHAISEDRIAQAQDLKNKVIPAKQEELKVVAAKYKKEKATFDEMKQKREVTKKDFDDSYQAYQEAAQKIREQESIIEKAKSEDYPKCPCGKSFQVCNHSGKVQLKEIDVDESAKKSAIDAAAKKIEFLQKAKKAEEKEYQDCRERDDLASKYIQTQMKVVARLRDEGVALKAEIKTLEERAKDADKKPSDGNDLERSAAENERDVAERRRRAWVENDKATHYHEEVVAYTSIEELLRPTGVREQVIKPRMDKLRSVLFNINAITGWNPISITDDYNILSNDRPVQLASQHEKYQAQWAIQCAITILVPKTQFLILDCCDIVRGENWDGLVHLVNRVNLQRLKQIKKLKGEGKPYPEPLTIVMCATETEAPEFWNEIWLGEE
ncbi:MAG: AAA family ATPase [Gammaproteobacteria bacterium]|nr:AAA family ATPase [Gammaproteobacteria bacterium]